jgi:predicted ATPase/class 3 adenylate cyclase
LIDQTGVKSGVVRMSALLAPAAPTAYPTGTVAFLFTDIEGSTRLWERDPAAMRRAVERHNALLDAAIDANQGVRFKTIGDAVQAAFHDVPAAVVAAVAAQRALAAEAWDETGPLRVRMAIHVGAAAPIGGDYLAPCLNRLARLLAAGSGGQTLLTDAARLLTADRLPDGVALRDLGRHRLRDLLAPEDVWQLVVPGLPDQFPPLKSLERHTTNLPSQPNALVGRERDLAAIAALLTRPETRLLTLTGPGGAGKTRLALQAAADGVDAWPDGAVFVDLAALTDPTLILPQIAETLGVRESGGLDLRGALLHFLSGKTLLLLLDNLEQFRPPEAAGRVVADLLAANPGLTILATSRAPLRIRAEREYPVPPLDAPDPARLPPLDELAEIPAVRLFVERAQAARPGFALTDDNAGAVAKMCVWLDGLPLAIELAAARLRALAPGDLARRLGGKLDLLAGRAADRPDRQQTLRATIDWSHDLLTPDEQALFRRLSVFAGGCTLEAAETVAAAPAPLDLDPLDGITILVEQSLLRTDERGDETRYRMLETLRAYGRERLAEAGEEAAAREAHGAWFGRMANDAGTALSGPNGWHWPALLDAELDNVRSAIEWALDSRKTAIALKLTADLTPYWQMRGDFTEGRRWLQRALVADNGGPSRERAEASEGAASLANDQGDFESATTYADQALALYRAIGDRRGEAVSLLSLGIATERQAEYTRSIAYYEDGIAILRELGERHRLSKGLNGLGLALWHSGDAARGRALLEESLAIKRELGDRKGIAVALTNLAVLSYEQGDVAQTIAWLEQSLEIDRELGNEPGIADDLDNLGGVLAMHGEPARAAGMLAEALAYRREMADRLSVAFSLENIASLLDAAGDVTEAARLLGAAEALREAIDAPLPPSEQERFDQGIAAGHAAIGEAAFEAARAAGRALDWETAAAEAQAAAERIARAAMPSPATANGVVRG